MPVGAGLSRIDAGDLGTGVIYSPPPPPRQHVSLFREIQIRIRETGCSLDQECPSTGWVVPVAACGPATARTGVAAAVVVETYCTKIAFLPPGSTSGRREEGGDGGMGREEEVCPPALL